MTKTQFDRCYSAFEGGRLILTPAFAASIAQTYRKLGLTVPEICAPGRAYDAAPARVSPPLARFRARRAARAFDAEVRALHIPEVPRPPDYRALQAAADERRGVPAKFGGVAYRTEAERDLARRRQRARGGMATATDFVVDSYIHLEAAYKARRTNAS